MDNNCEELRQICWATLESSMDDIGRIANYGPNLGDADDENLVATVFAVVCGELNWRKYVQQQQISQN